MAKRKKKPIKIDFPYAEGNYWEVEWIYEIHYEKERKIEVHFRNKHIAHECKFGSEILYRTKLPVSSLSELGIGSVYNVRENKFEDLHLNELFEFSVEENLFLAKKEFPLIGIKNFLPNAAEIKPTGFSYLKTFGRSSSRKRHILISPYTILQYLLFYNDELITKAMCGELLDGFKVSQIKYRNCAETGELIGMLRYDVAKLSQEEAVLIAPYLVLKNNAGIKFLKSISSHVNSAFLNTLHGSKSSYPLFFWQEFWNYKISVIGKSFYNEDKSYLLAHRICNFKFNDLNPFTIDKIELFPLNEKNSTDDRENHKPENIDKPGNPTIDGVSLSLNAGSANPHPPLNTQENNAVSNPFNIPVEIIKRDKQLSAYDVNYIPNDLQVADLTRELENLEIDSNNIIENIKTIVIKTNNFEYFNVLIEILKKEFFLTDPRFKVNLHYCPNGKDSFYVAEILNQSKTMYLIEFGNGIIGVFSSISLKRIGLDYLSLLVKGFINYTEKVGKRKVLWTYIKDQYDSGRLNEVSDKKIIIYTGVNHQKKINGDNKMDPKEALKTATRKTASIIFETRIKRILT
ncbi:hypothetical protein [Chryseobacterium sp. HMWF035]|uniref:hypothetical protein n=2 Tax=unclassified Chryseobacterium TaxID=2593645 RepID=UPI000F50D5E9|nr:hypothetical protein [Chryseobacterium sp. HMWF035]